MCHAMEPTKWRYLALAELLLAEIHEANEHTATIEHVAESLSRMIEIMEAYRATGGDVAELLDKAVQTMETYREGLIDRQ